MVEKKNFKKENYFLKSKISTLNRQVEEVTNKGISRDDYKHPFLQTNELCAVCNTKVMEGGCNHEPKLRRTPRNRSLPRMITAKPANKFNFSKLAP